MKNSELEAKIEALCEAEGIDIDLNCIDMMTPRGRFFAASDCHTCVAEVDPPFVSRSKALRMIWSDLRQGIADCDDDCTCWTEKLEEVFVPGFTRFRMPSLKRFTDRASLEKAYAPAVYQEKERRRVAKQVREMRRVGMTNDVARELCRLPRQRVTAEAYTQRAIESRGEAARRSQHLNGGDYRTPHAQNDGYTMCGHDDALSYAIEDCRKDARECINIARILKGQI